MSQHELVHTKEQSIEIHKLELLIQQCPELGGFNLVPIGEAGYVLQSKKQLPMSGNDWFLFDLDDTLVAYTEAKSPRNELFSDYLTKRGLVENESASSKLISLADQYSRWSDIDGQGSIYHAQGHLIILQWLTDTLIKKQKRTPQREIDLDAFLVQREKRLKRITLQLSKKTKPLKTDPFRFDLESKKMVLRGAKSPWSEQIEHIFTSTTFNPQPYPEMIDATASLGKPRDSIHRNNIGIFTKGDPYFQLYKVFELMKKHPELPISHIWLTRTNKGDFILETSKNRSMQMLDQNYVPSDLTENGDEGFALGSGNIFGQHSHNIIMLDDTPKELTSMHATNDALKTLGGAEFITVRSLRPNTKEAHKHWEIVSEFGVIDFTSQVFSSQDVNKILMINRYLATRKSLGRANARTKYIERELQQLGITIDSIQQL